MGLHIGTRGATLVHSAIGLEKRKKTVNKVIYMRKLPSRFNNIEDIEDKS